MDETTRVAVLGAGPSISHVLGRLHGHKLDMIAAEDRALNERRYDLLHVCGPAPATSEAFLAARRDQVPVVASFHPSLSGTLYHRCAVVLSPGRAADQALDQAGVPATRVCRWEPGVDPQEYRSVSRDPAPALAAARIRLLDVADRSSRRMRLRFRPTVRGWADDHAVSWRSTRASARAAEQARQIAVIDLGSNSWRLVVFTYAPGAWWKRTDELYETVRIGAGLGASGRLSEAAMQRGLETLGVFARFCRANSLAPADIYPVATSAIRDASNREEFLRRAREQTGLEIEVISAEDEARYGYVAAVNTSTITDGVVVELGGGSMQLVQVRDRRAQDLRSFQLGAVRLTERFLSGTGTPKKKELQKVRAHVREALAEIDWLARSGKRLVGTGGAARNLAAAAQRGAEELDLGVQGFVITTEAMAELVQTLAGLPASERGSVSGIKPGRGDIILAAALVFETVLDVGRFEGMEVTEAGLRDGVFLARTLLAGGEPLFDDVRQAAVRNLAIQYESDMTHSEHVARLALQMHESLVDAKLFEPKPDERELLWAASMLHDVGMTISYDDHHKHSHYLIVSAELPGFDPRERALIAQISRYHRKGAPKLGEMSAIAEKGDDQMLDRCAVILRLAEHLERGRDQSVSEARLRANGHGVDLHLEAAGDLTLPRWSVERYGDDEMFQRVFGRRLLIG